MTDAELRTALLVRASRGTSGYRNAEDALDRLCGFERAARILSTLDRLAGTS